MTRLFLPWQPNQESFWYFESLSISQMLKYNGNAICFLFTPMLLMLKL